MERQCYSLLGTDCTALLPSKRSLFLPLFMSLLPNPPWFQTSSPHPSHPSSSNLQLLGSRSNDPNGLNSSIDKPVTSRSNPIKAATLVGKQTKKPSYEPLVDLSTLIVHAPGAIAAARREQVSLLQAQRKMKIAHYGRTSARLQEMGASWDDASANSNDVQEEKKCSFITANSDPLYVAYHDEECGVPVHDDKMLFELLVLSSAQVGSDWISILRKRTD